MKKPIPFGKYLLLDRVNVGGMAEVFKAKAFGVEGFERLVAVKRILPSIAEDAEFIEMFIDEAKIAVQLTHANIAQIFDLGRVGESYFIALEYVHGKDLRTIFDRARKRGEPLPVPMACFNIMKVCEGLAYAHDKKDAAGRELNLVHRDVSPQNVLISYDGEVKLIDFGIAKAAGKASKTQAGILKGKFGYMSPEQVRGLPLDRRSDVFAVGIVLYELLTGERLFVGETDFSTLEKVRNVEIMPPSTYNRRIPDELEQIVLKALSKDVDDRYQTAMDLHDDLQSFMYTSGNFFARKDLAAYMRKTFAEEIAKESAKDEEFAKITAPPASGLGAFDDLPPAQGAGVPTAAPPKPSQRKATLMGVPAAPPPPPGPRVSKAPAPPPPPPPRVSAAPPEVAAPPSAPPIPPSVGPAPIAAAPSGPAMEMDWDEEELSTQIYDKPEDFKLAPSGPAPLPPISQPAPIAPPSAGPPRTAPPIVSRPPAATPAVGAPSPFDLPATPYAPPSASPEVNPARREPTAVTPRPREPEPAKKSNTVMLLVAAGLAVALLAAVGGWWLFGRSGTIQLTTTPADPIVLFDTRPVQATSSPFVIGDVEPGVHLIEVSKTGFQTWSQQVTVPAGQSLTVGPVVLNPVAGAAGGVPSVAAGPGVGAVGAAGAAGAGVVASAGTVGFTIDTDPSGARVLVDGREWPQRTPATVTALAPGAHAVRVEGGAQYEPWETQLQLVAGQVLALPRASLALRAVSVEFRSVPDGAQVTLVRGTERRSLGTTPTRSDVEFAGGAWTVELSRDGYETNRRELTLVQGVPSTTFEGTLAERARAGAPRPAGGGARPAPRPTPVASTRPSGGGGETRPAAAPAAGGTGTLRINTRPWSQVYVDGALIGNTPQMNIPLRAGTHRVTLVNSEFNIRETITVNIAAGATETKVLTLTPGG